MYVGIYYYGKIKEPVKSVDSHTKNNLNCLIPLTLIHLFITLKKILGKVGNIIKIRLFQYPLKD